MVSAAAAIHALNPGVNVIAHDAVLGPTNVDELIAGYDVILDGTDTFETRYTLNDAAVAARIPVIHASVFRFEGQLTTFVPYRGAVLPLPLPDSAAARSSRPRCSVAGVLGVVPGIMGLLQANEALKVLLGIGDTLAGRLLLFDALDASFTELKLRRDPACPVCSDAAIAARAAAVPLALPGSSPDAARAAGTSDVASPDVSPGATEALRFPFPPPSRDVPA